MRKDLDTGVEFYSNANLNKGAFLCWRDVSIYPKKSFLKSKSNKLSNLLLDSVYGYAEPGKISCIVGDNNSGKTLLLNYLFGTIDKSLKALGELTINGVLNRYDTHLLEMVPEYDIFPSFVTLKEHIMFYAKLKLSNRYTSKEIIDKAERLIKLFNLEDKVDRYLYNPEEIFDNNEFLTLNEMRTLSLVIGLISENNILLIDAPFKYADIEFTRNAMKVLKNYAISYNISIIITSCIWDKKMFENADILITMKYGIVTFCGKTKENIENSINNNMLESMRTLSVEQLCVEGKKMDKILTNNIFEEAVKYSIPPKETSLFYKIMGNFGAPLNVQLIELSKRRSKALLRNNMKIFFSFFLFISAATFISLGYSLFGFIGEAAEETGRFIFLEVVCISAIGLIYAIFTNYEDIKNFNREYRNNLYGSGMLFLEKLISELPLNTILCICFSIICYYVVGLRPSFNAFVVHTIYLIYCFETAYSAASFICIQFGVVAAIAAIVPSFCAPILAISSYFLKESEIPIYIRWVKYVSWVFYGYEALEIINFRDAKIPHIGNHTYKILNTIGDNDFIDGNKFLKSFVSHPEFYHISFICILVVCVGFRVLSGILLKIKTLHGRIPYTL